ncbi:hypothetical protein V6N12_065308 [Hibiscus sabdariffa]|uniref:Reverse transcriptase n=1 Tax=Hibiscus sabdariffa TaxID=183260 RepID=A0ABR2G8C4_9ROSI
MMELAIKGGSFTWSNQRCTEDSILEKLDRVLSTREWDLMFLKAIGVMEAAIASDHAPIILLLSDLKKKWKKDSKFESKWLLEEECSSNIKEAWNSILQSSNSKTFERKLKTTRAKLRKWSRKKFGNNKKSIEEIKKTLLELQAGPLTKGIKRMLGARLEVVPQKDVGAILAAIDDSAIDDSVVITDFF